MHRRGAQKENQDAAIFGRNRTPCVGGWLSRATSPVLHYLRRNSDKIRLPNSKSDQTGTHGCGSDPGYGPTPAAQPGPRPGSDPGYGPTLAAQPGPRPSPARDPPSLGPEAPCLPHHLAPRRAPAASKCVAAASRKQKGVFERVHYAAPRTMPTWPQPLQAPAAGRTHLRRTAAAAAAIAAPRCWPSPSPSPVRAGAKARGIVARSGDVGGGCGAQPGRPIPSRTRRTRRTLRTPSVGARLQGAPHCLGWALVAGLRRGGRGLRGRIWQGRGGAVGGTGRAGPGCGRSAVEAELGAPGGACCTSSEALAGSRPVLDTECGCWPGGAGVGAPLRVHSHSFSACASVRGSSASPLPTSQ